MIWPWSKRSVVTVNQYPWAWSPPLGQETKRGAFEAYKVFPLDYEKANIAIERLKHRFPQVRFHVEAWAGKDRESTSAFKLVSFARSSVFPSEADLMAKLDDARQSILQEVFEGAGSC